MTILLSPHQDDETLFACYTLLREKPCVVFCTRPYVQQKRGQASYHERMDEAQKVMEMLDLDFITLPLSDEGFTEEQLEEELEMRLEGTPITKVYAPAIEGYATQHDQVGRVADKLWPGIVTHYMTYVRENLHTPGKTEIIPTEEERAKKNQALDLYLSQLRLNGPHFDAVRNLPEYYQ